MKCLRTCWPSVTAGACGRKSAECVRAVVTEGLSVMLRSTASSVRMWPGQPHRPLTHRGSRPGLMLGCHHLEILNSWTRGPAFHLVLGPTNYSATHGKEFKQYVFLEKKKSKDRVKNPHYSWLSDFNKRQSGYVNANNSQKKEEKALLKTAPDPTNTGNRFHDCDPWPFLLILAPTQVWKYPPVHYSTNF